MADQAAPPGSRGRGETPRRSLQRCLRPRRAIRLNTSGNCSASASSVRPSRLSLSLQGAIPSVSERAKSSPNPERRHGRGCVSRFATKPSTTWPCVIGHRTDRTKVIDRPDQAKPLGQLHHHRQRAPAVRTTSSRSYSTDHSSPPRRGSLPAENRASASSAGARPFLYSS
jgi:hypothetical protein